MCSQNYDHSYLMGAVSQDIPVASSTSSIIGSHSSEHLATPTQTSIHEPSFELADPPHHFSESAEFQREVEIPQSKLDSRRASSPTVHFRFHFKH